MKKQYATPDLDIVQCPNIQIICQSISFDGNGDGRPAGAQKRNNPIFDDEEDI